MKKFFQIIFAVTLTLTIFGCGTQQKKSEVTAPTETVTEKNSTEEKIFVELQPEEKFSPQK